MAHADDCLRCHGRPNLVKIEDDRRISLYVNETWYRASAHARLSCDACHYGVHPSKLSYSCEHCHVPGNPRGAPDFSRQIREYQSSVHGRARANGAADVAACADCHHPHYAVRLGPPRSIAEKQYVVSTCSRCHADPQVVGKHGLSPDKTARAYASSIHGQALAQGNARAPACTDCHGLHRILPPSDPSSSVARENVPNICGKCHAAIASEYRQSVHGKAWAAGVTDAPVCTDCHGEHNILPPTASASQVSPVHITATCSSCHANARIYRRYDLSTRRLETYRQSYHGISAEFGDTRVANCASCHGAHDILPSSDPRSRIYPANLPATCGKCHPGATELFTKGTIHLDPSPAHDRGVYYVRISYWIFIMALIGFFLLSIALDLKSLVRSRVVSHKGEELAGYERFSIHARIQHMILITAFFLLVLTGFPVLYHDTLMARVILTIVGGPIGRAIIHRVGAALLIWTCLYHLVIVLFTPRGRADFKAMLPVKKDLLDMRDMYLFYLGRRSEKPRFDRFNYVEKFEYYAMGWGSAVMTVSGLALAYEVAAMRVLPKWAWDIVYSIHGYEALLAFLAIIIWHLYNAHLRPGIFPMNWVWITGKVSEEGFREEHPLEYERWRGDEARREG